MTKPNKGAQKPNSALAILPTALATAVQTYGDVSKKAANAQAALQETTSEVVAKMVECNYPLNYLSQCTGTKAKELGLSATAAKLWRDNHRALKIGVSMGALKTAADKALFAEFDSKAQCEKKRKGKGEQWSKLNGTVNSYMASLRTAYQTALDKKDAGEDPAKKRVYTDSEKLWRYVNKYVERLQNLDPEAATAVCGKRGLVATIALARDLRDTHNKPSNEEKA